MGTHPIFESDFDCLTDLKKMNDTFEKRLELIMGPSRDIILEGVEDTDTMDRIFAVLDNINKDRLSFHTNKNSGSFSSSSGYDSDWCNSGHTLVSPVKIAKNKKLATLSKKDKLEATPSEVELVKLELEEEKLKSIRLRDQLESSLKREKQLRVQIEDLLQALEAKSK